MMVDTTIYGYVTEGGAFCPRCVGPEDDASAGALYSIDDNENGGLSCDACGEWIFEPDYGALWEDAISDILNDSGNTWGKASRILDLFREAGFDPEGARPDSY